MIVVVTRTGSGRSLVWFPILFNAPCDLKERRELFHRCSKNRIGKIFAGVISDFVQSSLWCEGKERSSPSLFQEQVREDIRRCDFRLCESREEYFRSSTERFVVWRSLDLSLLNSGVLYRLLCRRSGSLCDFWAQTDLRNRFCDRGWFTRWFWIWGWRCNAGIISILVPLRSRRTPGRGRRRVKARNLRGALLWIQRWSERSALQLTRCSQWKGRWNRPWETVAGGWKRSTSERVMAGGDFCKPADARGGGGGQDLRHTFQGRINTTLCLNEIKKSSRSAAGPWRAARGSARRAELVLSPLLQNVAGYSVQGYLE